MPASRCRPGIGHCSLRPDPATYKRWRCATMTDSYTPRRSGLTHGCFANWSMLAARSAWRLSTQARQAQSTPSIKIVLLAAITFPRARLARSANGKKERATPCSFGQTTTVTWARPDDAMSSKLSEKAAGPGETSLSLLKTCNECDNLEAKSRASSMHVPRPTLFRMDGDSTQSCQSNHDHAKAEQA